jgi:hypothetical protein
MGNVSLWQFYREHTMTIMIIIVDIPTMEIMVSKQMYIFIIEVNHVFLDLTTCILENWRKKNENLKSTK